MHFCMIVDSGIWSGASGEREAGVWVEEETRTAGRKEEERGRETGRGDGESENRDERNAGGEGEERGRVARSSEKCQWNEIKGIFNFFL